MNDDLKEKYIEAARGMYADDDVNIDDDAKFSEVDGAGCWVSAWVWVSQGEIDE